ncbi:cold shock domain-containing protein [Aggregatilinea lenta]|uniref:cold shock domain-containing protein n=1 Tax=Aggregatilinea lenta TaxID=913108 RepID=UPI000E5B9BAF|nr:cold shock domain-containing protein [Aggregatilinea lenta]
MSQEHVQYLRGTVQSYDDKSGYGYVLPDNNEEIDSTTVFFHWKSLRHQGDMMRDGDRVLFLAKSVPTGLMAVDVHHEIDSNPTPNESAEERVSGVISSAIYERGFGFITIFGREIDAFFHIRNLSEPYSPLPQGTLVTCKIQDTERGLSAYDIVPEEDVIAASGLGLLSQAILARDNRKYDKAARLYEQGLQEKPSIQLILSYAAMEKGRGRKSNAMRIYEQGIRLFPSHAKLKEDAGRLAASIGEHDKGLALLHDALKLSARANRGQKGVLLALADIYYQIGSAETLKKAVQYYEEAFELFGKSQSQFPQRDFLAMNLAKIRTQHHRGEITIRFFRELNFQIIRARLFEQTTEGAEFVIDITNQNLIESYGIANHLLVHCMFKSRIERSDLDRVDQYTRERAESGLIEDQVAFMVVASIPDSLQRVLWRRIENRDGNTPVIIPLPQSEIEASAGEKTFREILDRWLYSRDLFSGNRPVVGRRFFGRDKSLAELRDTIDMNTCAGVFGLRKIGKTSLLKEIQRRLNTGGDVSVFIDLLRIPAGTANCDWLYWKLSNELHNQVTTRFKRYNAIKNLKWYLGGRFDNYFEIPERFSVANAFDADLNTLLVTLSQLNTTPIPRVVLLFDEIERLLPLHGAGGLDGFVEFLGYFRGTNQESDGITVIVAGANAAITEMSQFNGRDNPVFNFFREIYLPLLEKNECDTMIRELGRGMGIHFNDDALECIYRLTGGHPFFARQFCSYLAEQYRERPLRIVKSMVENITEQYIDLKGKDFQEIVDRLQRDFPIEQAICVDLAKAGGCMPFARLRQQLPQSSGASIRHLTGYQIVTLDSLEIRLTMELFTRWLLRNASI